MLSSLLGISVVRVSMFDCQQFDRLFLLRQCVRKFAVVYVWQASDIEALRAQLRLANEATATSEKKGEQLRVSWARCQLPACF